MKRQAVILTIVLLLGGLTTVVVLHMRSPVEAPNRSAAPAPAPTGDRAALAEIAAGLPVQYAPAGIVGESPMFNDRLADLAVGPGDHLYVVGDQQVKIFDHCYAPQGGFALPGPATCIAVDGESNLYIAIGRRVLKYSRAGEQLAVITDESLRSEPTDLAVVGEDLLVAEVAPATDLDPPGRIHRFTLTGQYLGELGGDQPVRLLAPNDRLSIAADPQGYLAVSNPGRHQVWQLDRAGRVTGRWGEYDTEAPAGFVGCCNPVNLAVTSDGRIVTAEKVAARVKLFSRSGELMGIVPAWHIDPAGTNFPLAAAAGGRIVVADPTTREVRIYTPLP